MASPPSLLAVCVAFAVCCHGITAAPKRTVSPFADLSVEEYQQLQRYLYTQRDLNLHIGTFPAPMNTAHIFLIEAIRPAKTEALGYLDQGKPAPERAARVIIQRGDLEPPVIQEYRVSPIPNPTTHTQIKNPGWKDPIPFNARSAIAYPQIIWWIDRLNREMGAFNDILSEITGGWQVGNCTKKCLSFELGIPPYLEAGHNKIMPYLTKAVEGKYLHPIGVQFIINMDNIDHQQWPIETVWFQGQYFPNLAALRQAHREKKLKLNKIPEADGIFTKNLRSSLNFRGEPRPAEPKRGPRVTLPDGDRFTVTDRRVQWMGWDFEFSMLASSGIQLNNVKFLKERIAYELSLQEVGVFYSGGSPAPRHNTYYDSFTILGTRTSELFVGIDCPNHAKFFSVVHYLNGNPHVFQNSICIFEHDRGVPLRRHMATDNNGGYHYAQGIPDNVLIVRQMLTVENYDYITDFMFHQAGQIEGKVSLTGYLLNTYNTGPYMSKYGYTVNVPTSQGNIHNHIIGLKADLDIKGEKNRFETLDIKIEDIQDDLDPSKNLLNRYVEKSLKKTEMEAAYRYNFSTPKYLVMYNEYEKNELGHSRGYRIVSDAMTKVLLPTNYRGFRSRAWAEYQVAVTKQKDTEQWSSSIYSTFEPYDPVMSFEDFIKDNESIIDQDLVAWITLGTHHIPHTEDVPIVTTPGVQLTWFLLPYNYFDEDPSLASRDNIRVNRQQNGENHWEYSGVKPDHDIAYTFKTNAGLSNSVSPILIIVSLLALCFYQ